MSTFGGTFENRLNDPVVANDFKIQYRGIGSFWTFQKPWTVFEWKTGIVRSDRYSYPVETTFRTKKLAEQYVVLKMLER